MTNTADVTGGKPIAVLLQSISGVSAINPLVAFYDIHGGKREVLIFYFIPNTTRDSGMYVHYNICIVLCCMLCSDFTVSGRTVATIIVISLYRIINYEY
jgi:hypothetical protein